MSTFGSVNRNLGARSASQSFGYNEGGVKFRVYAREGNFSDIGQRVWYGAYDFDSNDTGSPLLGVTISYLRLASAGPSQVFRDRLAALTAKWSASTSRSPHQYQISTPYGVRVTLAEDAKNEVVNESYVLIAGEPSG